MDVRLRGRLMKSLRLLIDDDLYGKLRRSAAGRGESVAEVIRKTLRQGLDDQDEAAGEGAPKGPAY